jgi:hypothetical protein
MDSVKIWNRIVEHYKANYSAKEEIIQKDWEQIFSAFGYNSFFGEIDAHRSIHIGSHQRTIPDIIIHSEEGDLFDVELKQYNLPFVIEFENQLKSYLDLLHISVGVLVCQKIYLYVYDFSKSKLKKISISFTENNPDGIMFVELMQKGSFSADKIEKFIDSKKKFNENVKSIKTAITSELLRELVLAHFNAQYSKDEVVAALNDVVLNVQSAQTTSTPAGPNLGGGQPLSPKTGNGSATQPASSNESIQNWVKRIFAYLLNNKLLTFEEVIRLHDTEYSKKTFGVGHAILVDHQKDTIISGHGRYWQTPIGNYYICSQWWKEKDQEYNHNIIVWLSRVLPDYNERGLNRG